jgi:hypothetical protein
MSSIVDVPRLRSTRSGRFISVAISFFLLMTCLRVWIGPAPLLPRAEAQIPDAGLQRKLALEEAQRTNQLLSDIKRLLETHTLNVRIQGADNPADGGRDPRRDQ